ncbi:Rieske (2Fe-2S) protein, partial [Streptomyces sp. NPDC005093]
MPSSQSNHSATTEQDRPEWPDELTRVPYWVFQRQDVYRGEQANLFQGPYWSYLCLEAEVPEPGDYRTTFVGDTPVIVT